MKKLHLCGKALFVVLLLVVALCGCARSRPSSGGTPARVVIGVQHGLTVAPELIYAQEKGVLKKRFPKTAFAVDEAGGTADNPMTDLTNLADGMTQSSYDFVYVDFSSLLEMLDYGAAKGGPPQYRIVAGGTFRNKVLMSDHDIRSLKDLAGRTVGIYNKSHDTEMLLNKLLAKVGLKTAALGGSVKVRYGSHDELLNAFEDGAIQAFYIHVSDYPPLADAGKVVLDSGLSSPFGSHTTGTVLAVSTRFLKEHPDFVRQMIDTHVECSREATGSNFINLAYTFYRGEQTTATLELKYRGETTSPVIPTYDPDLQYLQDSFQFVKAAGYAHSLPPFNKAVDLSILDGVLKSRGLGPL